MSISEYRDRILERLQTSSSDIAREADDWLELAHSKAKIGELIWILNDNGTSADEKTRAIVMMNTVRNFSPVMRKLQPEIINALRGQIEAPNVGLRRSAISTLAAMKDEMVQELLLEDISSDKPEEEKLLPTASALAMLARDEKAVPSSVLRKIMMSPPNEESQIAAIRQMPSDPDVCEDLLSLMKDENVPLAAREMIPGMVSEADPLAFLNAATEMLNDSGEESELAPWLVKGMSHISAPEAAEAVDSAKKLVSKLRKRKKAPASFKSAASALLDNGNKPEQ